MTELNCQTAWFMADLTRVKTKADLRIDTDLPPLNTIFQYIDQGSFF